MTTENQLSRADRMRIRAAVQGVKDWQKANPQAPDLMKMGAGLADILRSELPDVDAVEMGRVCLNLAEFIDAMLDDTGPQCPVVMAAANQIKTAGFDLTATEWEETPS